MLFNSILKLNCGINLIVYSMSERMRFADFHQDTLNPQLVEILNKPELSHAQERAVQLPKEGMKKLDIIFSSVYRRQNAEEKEAAKIGDENKLKSIREDNFKLIDYYKSLENFRIIEKPEDLQIREENDPNNIILHLEGGDIISDPDMVDELYKRGVRSVGPLYSHDNQLGGGAGGNKNRGLTALGKRVIDRIIEKGMVIDLAHANRLTSHDILERVGNYNKMAATHTGMGGSEFLPKNSQRYITSELIKKIADKGGVVGFTPAKAFFSSLQKYVDTLKKASDLTGSTKNLAVGSDFGGMDAKHLFSEFDEVGKFGIIAEKLSNSGHFTDEEIADIMYGNIEKIIKKL